MFRICLGSALLLGAGAQNVTEDNFCPTGDYREYFGGDGGTAFDDCNDKAYKGGITKVCGRGKGCLDLIHVEYAGQSAEHGGQGGDWSCFEFREDEFITNIALSEGPDWGTTVIYSFSFTTNQGRNSPNWGGGWKNPSAAYISKGPCEDCHVVSMFGRAAKYVDRIGFSWGTGGNGVGSWYQKSCQGCTMPWSWETQECTTQSNTDTKQVTSSWTLAAKSDLNLGFKFHGVGSSEDLSISGSYAHTVATSTSSSFEKKDCSTVDRSCSKNYFYQWQIQTQLGTHDPDTTKTGVVVCTDAAEACCMPGTFSDDPSDCDLDRNAPNTCSSRDVSV